MMKTKKLKILTQGGKGKGTIISNTTAQGGQLRVVSPDAKETDPGTIQTYIDPAETIEAGALYEIVWDATKKNYQLGRKLEAAKVTVTIKNGVTEVELVSNGDYSGGASTQMTSYNANPQTVTDGSTPNYVAQPLTNTGTFPCAIIPPFRSGETNITNGVDFVDFNNAGPGSGF